MGFLSRIAVVLAIAAFAVGPGRAAAQADPSSNCHITTSERIVAVGDVHGAYAQFVAILRAAGLIDARERWTGGRAILVQTGDVLDRGADSRKAVDLLRRLERDAPRAGGRVVALLGNHELMRLVGDWRYVSAGELKAFQTLESADQREAVYARAAAQAESRAKAEKRVFDAAAYREQFMKDIPLGYIEMRVAFDSGGDYGKWMRARDAVARINGILFLHGGISDAVASLGCDGVNAQVRADLAMLAGPPEKSAALLSSSASGPLWYRGLAQEAEATFEPTLTSILGRSGARAIVIGHTTVLPGRIATRFGGRVIQIDTGMLDGTFYPGGVPSALEIKGDAMAAVYLDRREALPTPALETKD